MLLKRTKESSFMGTNSEDSGCDSLTTIHFGRASPATERERHPSNRRIFSDKRYTASQHSDPLNCTRRKFQQTERGVGRLTGMVTSVDSEKQPTNRLKDIENLNSLQRTLSPDGFYSNSRGSPVPRTLTQIPRKARSPPRFSPPPPPPLEF